MSNDTNKDVVTRFIAEVWNGHCLDALDTFLAPEYYDYSYEPRNREGLERTLVLMQSAFPDHETIIEEIAEESDTVAICFTLRGTQTGPFRGVAASGKPFAVGGYRFYKVRGGKIVSHRGLIDLPALLGQLGAHR